MRFSLRRLVITSILSSYVVVVLLFVVPASVIYHRQVEQGLLETASRLSRIVAVSTLPHYVRYHRRDLGRIVEASGQRPGVSYIIIQDNNGWVLASSHPDEVGRILEDPISQRVVKSRVELFQEIGHPPSGLFHQFGHTFDISIPFTWEGEQIGSIRVGISTRSANRRMMQSQLLGVVVSVLVIAFGVAAILIVDRRMRSSLRRLIAGTQRIAEGDLKQRVQIHSGDELEELGSTFNRMADQLAQSRAELEEKVEARTQELQKLTRVLQETQSRQLRAERLAVLGEIAAGVSHEIRTPLNSLSINLQMLKRRLARGTWKTDGDDSAETLAMLDAEVRRINQVVEGFMRLARPHREELGEQNLNQAIRRILQLVDIEAARAGVKLHFLPCADLPPVRANGDQLHQVILNLVMNAIQAMPGGGRLTVSTAREEPDIVLTVADEGLGVPAELREKIFHPFFTTKPEGTGLGLAIVGRIVRAHGGRVTCLANGGQGALFEVRLPAAGAQEEHVREKRPG